MLSVTFPPGARTAPHRHPGWQLIYVLDGPIVSQMEGEQKREYQTGERAISMELLLRGQRNC